MTDTGPLHLLVIGQVLGLFFVIMTIVMVTRAEYYRSVMKNLKVDNGVIGLSASVTLILGLLLMVTHNRWEMDPDLILTVVAWIITLKAVLWLSFPEKMLAFSKKLYASNLYYVAAVIVGLAGVLLMSEGYSLFMPEWLPRF